MAFPNRPSTPPYKPYTYTQCVVDSLKNQAVTDIAKYRTTLKNQAIVLESACRTNMVFDRWMEIAEVIFHSSTRLPRDTESELKLCVEASETLKPSPWRI